MSFQIPNSNQFVSWIPGEFLTPSDYLVGTTGSDLPTTQDASLTDETEITVQFILRRNTFETDQKPKGYLEANKVLNLSYGRQVSYINSLSAKEVREWYGASADDIETISSYLIGNNANILEADQEKRFIKAKLTLGDFKTAFLAETPNIVFSEGDEEGSLYYYNPNNYADSYLHANGGDGELFADAVIGSRVFMAETEDENKSLRTSNVRVIENNTPTEIGGGPSFNYYPLEVAAQYNFPDHNKTGAGKNVAIGIVGTGGEELEKYLSINNTLDNYLKAQGINPKKIGRLFSPNTAYDPSDPNPIDWGEVTLDFSILRSLAPKSDIYLSKTGNGSMATLYNAYAELIYSDKIDVISNSASYSFQPGNFNETEALNELFIDALVRGKSIVSAAGDVGTASNNNDLIPNGLPIPYPDASPAIVTVGGLAFNKQAQDLIWPRSNVILPTAFPPSFSPKTIDELTGLISGQYTWNSNRFFPLPEAERQKDYLIYPENSSEFTKEQLLDGQFFNALINSIGSSGVQNSSILPMPRYQSKNLNKQWLGTGRRYPDVSVLAADNKVQGASSFYYQLGIKANEDKTEWIPTVFGNGGTSAGAPLVAGLIANLTSSIRKRFGKKQKLGLINPLLYESYNSKDRKNTLIDVPAGSNNANVFTIATSADDWSGYTIIYKDDGSGQEYLIPVNGTGPGGQLDTNLSSTGRGFDAATGLGSINGEGLLDQLVSVFSQL